MDLQVMQTLRSLEANHFEARFAESSSVAREEILNSIPRNAIVGVGDSATIRQIQILEELYGRGVAILNPFSKELTMDPSKTMTRDDISRRIFSCDVLLTGSNAVTENGKLVNIDGVGNRVASMIFGPKKVIIVVGRNKIVKDVEEALHRIKNFIAPYHARTKQSATPCAQTGGCVDCSSPKRICSVTTIIERKPWRTATTVILVNEDLGLGWDKNWPEERVKKIKSNYEKVTWVFARS